jgi:hypothetical protein
MGTTTNGWAVLAVVAFAIIAGLLTATAPL